jgi:hypothetical protein
MTTQRMHPTPERRWPFAVLLLTIILVTTACGSGLEAQAAAADSQVSAGQVASQGSLPARGLSGVASTAAQDVNADLVAGTDAAIYRVGQMAAVGDLRVTVDSVAVSAGVAGEMPDAGQHFLLVNITVVTTGKPAQALPFFSTSVTDMAGRHYFVEPRAGHLSAVQPPSVSRPLAGQATFSRGYMLPVDAGDLIWTAEDANHDRVTFAIRAIDLVTLR